MIETNTLTLVNDIPEELRNYARPFDRLRDGSLPKPIRECLYRLNAIRDVTSHSGFLQRRYYTNTRRIRLHHLLTQLTLAAASGFGANDFYAYGGHNGTQVKTFLRDYIGYFRRWEYRERLNDPSEAAILWNKIISNHILRAHGVSCSRMRAISFRGKWYLAGERITPHTIGDLNQVLEPGRYIYKPACGRWGRGVGSVDLEKEGGKIDGRYLTPIQAHEFLTERGLHEPILVENMLDNHDVLSALHVSSLNTVRVMTCREKAGKIAPFAAAIRIGIGHNIIDNWSAGGFASPIDIQTGEVGHPLKKSPTADESGLLITGASYKPVSVIPQWQQVLSLAVDAHKIFNGVRSIGWDIGITNAGPIILEGNDDWDIVLPQRVTGVGLWRTGFRKAILNH